MFESFKAYLNKDGYNYSEGLVDPFEFHTFIYQFLVNFKVADVENKYKPTWLNQNGVICIAGSSAALLLFISLSHGVAMADIPFVTEAGTYCILMCYELLIQFCIKQNLPQYHNLLRAMKADFYYICTEGEKYRQKFFAIQLQTWKICIITSIFIASVGAGMVIFTITSLLYYLATHEDGDERDRPFLFPLWLPKINLRETPYYEMVFVYVNVVTMFYSYNYIFMIQTQIAWIRHIASKADIIIWSIEDLFEGVHPPSNVEEKEYFSNLIVTRMRKIILHHQQMLSVLNDYAIVYKKLLMFEQQCCGPVTFLTAYSAATKLDEGELQPILILLSVASIVVYFLPSYFCTFLAFKVSSICDACWNTPFWTTGPVIRPYMVLMMQMSLRPLPLGAPGFEAFNLQTFSKKMTSAYSYFNMLRQINL